MKVTNNICTIIYLYEDDLLILKDSCYELCEIIVYQQH